jgi:hypothetical protein
MSLLIVTQSDELDRDVRAQLGARHDYQRVSHIHQADSALKSSKRYDAMIIDARPLTAYNYARTVNTDTRLIVLADRNTATTDLKRRAIVIELPLSGASVADAFASEPPSRRSWPPPEPQKK